MSESTESGALSVSSAARHIDFHLFRRIYVALVAHSIALSLHLQLLYSYLDLLERFHVEKFGFGFEVVPRRALLDVDRVPNNVRRQLPMRKQRSSYSYSVT